MARPLVSPRFLRRLVLLGTPLFLASLGLRQPVGITADVFHTLLPETDRWLTLHLAQIFLYGFLALAIYFSLEGLTGWPAAVSRVAAGVFAIFNAARDAVAGLAVGVLVDNARTLPALEQTVVARAVQKLWFSPLVGGGLSLIAVIGTMAWLISVLAAAAAHYRTGSSLTPVVFLIMAAVLYGITHTPPFGPLGMVCFLLAVLKLEWRQGRAETAPDSA